ncbi:hypothetical protein C8F04DRAFT_1256623 [Mycena alexandri]|uniref:Retrotransposon gag domain-containing protein n=1 Tax=Mycena alexandri TaxID=1745969 RepID=A0AAD6X7G4_9AGAR|nr:hypothetical protein C8F04DRAFT_1256623 [Mycena alexandri]
MLAAYVTSFAAIVLSFVVHVHATVSATVPISFPCAAYQPSTEHGVTHSHPRFMVVGALSLMFVVSALALRRAVSASYWSPPRGVSISIDSGSASAAHNFPAANGSTVPTIFPSPIPQSSSPPPYLNISPPFPEAWVTQLAKYSLSPPPTPHPLMPARHDHIAPIFDSQNPRHLRKYFSDLAFLFSRSSITDSCEKKLHTTRFLGLDDQDLWESVPEFADTSASFEQFTAAIFQLYPEADPSRRHNIPELKRLAAEFSITQLPSRTQLAEFYRRFYSIAAFLRAKQHLTEHEQSRIFCGAIPTSLRDPTHIRLQIKFPDVYTDDAYPLEGLREAVDFVLLQPSSYIPPKSHSPSAEYLSAPAESSNNVPHDIIEESTASTLSQPPSSSQCRNMQQSSCVYCTSTTHFIRHCPVVATDIHAGICKRNAEGKVVLPSGLFVPRHIIGSNLRVRIKFWHSRKMSRLAEAHNQFPNPLHQFSSSIPQRTHIPDPIQRQFSAPSVDTVAVFCASDPRNGLFLSSPNLIDEPQSTILAAHAQAEEETHSAGSH